MNISKCLKVKSRLVSRLAVLEQKLRISNVLNPELKASNEDFNALLKEHGEIVEKLILLKTGIAVANAGILGKLERQAQLKARIALFQGLNTNEFVQSKNVKSDKNPQTGAWNYELVEVKWITTLDTKTRDAQVLEMTKQIETLQDEIDDYNAKTKVKGIDGIA